ncbi:MAG: aminotransferase class III-fold pyridoxal phosphate-dependent enzyme [Thermomicrobiales bacterium]
MRRRSSTSFVNELEEVIEREGADTIAAMIGEPVQGAGGVLPPPQSYWTRVEILDANDILLIADEVMRVRPHRHDVRRPAVRRAAGYRLYRQRGVTSTTFRLARMA